MKKENERTTISIKKEKKEALEKKAVEISYKTGRVVKFNQLINYLLDNHELIIDESIVDKL